MARNICYLNLPPWLGGLLESETTFPAAMLSNTQSKIHLRLLDTRTQLLQHTRVHM